VSKSRWTPGVIAAVAVVGVLILCVGVVLVGSFLPTDEPDPTAGPTAGVTSGAPSRSTAGGKVIRFEVWAASGTASLVNWSTLEDSAILRDVPAAEDEPWVHEATLETTFGLVGVNASATSGLVSCRLLVDGVQVDEGESEGTVNCSATVR
jgi:hypothetical protein